MDSTIEELLKVGIGYEEAARDFYRKFADQVRVPGARTMLLELAQEEERHRALLARTLAGEDVMLGWEAPGPREDLQLAETLVAPELSENSSPGDVIVVAMQRELAAVSRYNDWARQFPGTPLARLAVRLATEEMAHKSRLEQLYDEEFLKYN